MKLLSLILLAVSAFAQTTTYPPAIDTDATLLVAGDNVQTTLSTAMLIGDNVAVVASNTGWAVNMIATVCDTISTIGSSTDRQNKCTAWEHMKVTAINGNVLTVTRGVNGTSARAHAAGRVIFNSIAAGYQKALKDAVIAIQTLLGPGGSNVALATTYNVTTYNFAAQTPGGSLSPGSNTITLTPVPSGVNGTDIAHRLYVSGGTGTPESCLINGGSATAGSASGSLTISCANAHSGAWTIQSATAGWQEAAQAAGANKTVYFPPGTYNIYGSFTVPFSSQTYFSESADLVSITTPNGTNLHRFAIVGAKTDITFWNLGFDGNFANQTYTAATLSDAIDGTDSIRLKVIGNRFRGFGYSASADASYAQVISLYTAFDCQVRGNQFFSNFAFEVNINGTTGCAVTDNTFGSQTLSASRTNVNWWDTYSAGFGTFVASSSKIFFSGNRMFGPQRSATLTAYGDLINVDGSNSSVTSSDIHIENNTFEGLGNGRGTVAVTNGSGTVVGTNTTFASLDPGRSFMVEGDTTVYKVTAYTSATQITVSPVMSRATGSGLRYQYVNSGDVIQVYNVDRFSIVGNSINHSGDNGIDVAASPAGYFTQHGVVANNVIRRSQVDAIYIGGAVFDVVFSANLGLNCGLKETIDHQACFELSPTDQGMQPGQNQWQLNFTGNQCIDDQPTTTMLHAFQTESGQSAKIFSNKMSANSYYSYEGTGTFFNSGTTETQQGTMFNSPSTTSAIGFTPVAFANLGGFTPAAANGTISYCFDCAVASPCAGGGTGAFAKRLNGAWVCN